MKDVIRVRGARQHNLRNLDVAIPRRAITVVTGPSGSGKSSLAFDTVYAEGQRRYVESLSAYARQFLERMEKPDVDSVEGISPAVAIEQQNPARSSRSTVGTATEIYDYLRLLWARIGRTQCPRCGRELAPDTPETVTDRLMREQPGARLLVTFPLRTSRDVRGEAIEENLRAQGFLRVVAGSDVLHLDDVRGRGLDLAGVPDLLVVVDRLSAAPEAVSRLSEAVGTAFREGDGDTVIQWADGSRLRFTDRFECPDDGYVATAPSPQLFSFNNPRGACDPCSGFGAVLTYDEVLIVPDPGRTLRDGAIDPWTKPRYDGRRRTLAEFCRQEGIPLDAPWRSLSSAQRDLLLHRRSGRGYRGIFPFLEDLEEKRYKQYIRVFLRQYQTAKTCSSCGGSRLKTEALNVRVGDRTIADVCREPVDELLAWMERLQLSEFDQAVAAHILREARDRTAFLCDVGLTYLTLERQTRTLSGGEAQRIALSNSLGASLVDTLYVLDEPSIGLHSRDLGRLLRLLEQLRDRGNTVLMVEHDLEAIRIADHMLELGPGAGDRGGQLVFDGPLSRAGTSPLTGKYLSGESALDIPKTRRPVNKRRLQVRGASAHTLRDVDVDIPLGTLTCVTGVSGSGKSTLVHDIIFRALESTLTGEHSAKLHLGETLGSWREISGQDAIDAVVLVDQEPIGRTPRSNPVTYVKAWDEIRRLFAALPASRQRKLTASHFSFNVKGGRCPTCEGAGYQQIEMVFMADVYVPCEVCAGKRFTPTVLEVTLNGRNIHDVLQLTVDQAIRFFPHEERLGQALWQLQQVGLGYLRLGQPATTLSGGEAQRVKIARELIQSSKTGGRKLYILDEPTTGLHLEDVRKLAHVLDRLVDAGHTVVLIEHQLDLIATADWVIDMGPEGGSGGGHVVAMGRPEDVMQVPGSHTGRALRPVLQRALTRP